MVPIPKYPLCDFCSQPILEGTCFLSEDRSLVLVRGESRTTIGSDEHWLSCNVCAELVRAKDAEGLAARSFANQPPTIPRDLLSLGSLVTVQSSLFWTGYRGEHPISEHPPLEGE